MLTKTTSNLEIFLAFNKRKKSNKKIRLNFKRTDSTPQQIEDIEIKKILKMTKDEYLNYKNRI